MALSEEIAQLLKEIEGQPIENPEQAEQFRLKYLSKKGQITSLFDQFRQVEPGLRREIGKQLNELKTMAEARWKLASEPAAGKQGDRQTDYTAPGWTYQLGSRHPISLVANEIHDISLATRDIGWRLPN